MPDTPTLTLILFIGLAAGVLLSLIGDTVYIERKAQEGKNEILRLENKVDVAETEIKHLREDLEDAKEWRGQAAHLLGDKENLEQTLDKAESQNRRLEAQVKGALLQLTETQKLHKQVALAEAEIKRLHAQLKEAKNQLVFLRLEGREDLTLVRGIGPAYARRLREAGIKTLGELATLEPSDLRRIVQLKEWQKADIAEWIAEAKDLAAVFADEEE